MAIKLLIHALDQQSESRVLDLDQSLITFGRSKSCHVELDHAEISRRHFIIKFEEECYWLVDENSRHGTLLDGQKIESQKSVMLKTEHEVVVPGFSIKLMCDGQKPKLERTTVVARKLLDELLQGEIRPRECPSLQSADGSYHFKFVEEKTSFVLGTLLKGDFVVADDKIAKKHLSFARDINGIRLIPLPGNHVFIDKNLVKEPQILIHGALISLGDTELIYREHHDETNDTFKGQQPPADEEKPIERPSALEESENKAKEKPFVRALDRLFLLAFFIVLAGASALFFELV